MNCSATTKAWLPFAKAGGHGALRLFCFHHAGGGASLFSRWLKGLAPQVEVLPVQLPGHQERLRERLHDRMPPLVDGLAEALLPELDVPFAFFGHSMGGLIAFQLARVLRQRHQLRPATLIVAGSPSPQGERPGPLLHQLPDGELIDSVQKRFGGIPAAIANHAEALRIFLPILRADLAVLENYHCQSEAELDCPILALAGTEDHCVSLAEVASWAKQTSAAFSLCTFPGGHFFLHDSVAGRAAVLRAVAGQLRLASKVFFHD
ncbi:MAG: alpha/beta fold hydrolase [Thermoguttaceae bacterium]